MCDTVVLPCQNAQLAQQAQSAQEKNAKLQMAMQTAKQAGTAPTALPLTHNEDYDRYRYSELVVFTF